MNYLGIKPEDWVSSSLNFGTDLSVHLRIRQKNGAAQGGEVAAHISINGTTGAITFEQGASTAAANTTTGDNPQIGATPGIIDLSALDPVTYKSLEDAINATDDWEAWLEGALPDDAPEAAGTGNFIVQTDLDCTVAAGAAVVGDASQALFSGAQLSFRGPSTKPHRHDGFVLHELEQVKATATYTGAGSLIVYACDDKAGTSTEILNIGAAASTVEKVYPVDAALSALPIASTKGKRLVVKLSAATTFTVAALYILGRSYAFGPGIRAANLESAQ